MRRCWPGCCSSICWRIFPLQPLGWIEDKIQHRARSRFLVLHALLHGVLAAWWWPVSACCTAGFSLQVLASLLIIAVSHYPDRFTEGHRDEPPEPGPQFPARSGIASGVIALLWLGLTPNAGELLARAGAATGALANRPGAGGPQPDLSADEPADRQLLAHWTPQCRLRPRPTTTRCCARANRLAIWRER
ncbi:DUF3307 domain-containing protein [Serratia ureilytica]